MSWALIVGWLSRVWKYILSNPIAQAVVIGVAALGVHKAIVWNERQQAVADERKEAKAKAVKRKTVVERKIVDAREKLREKQKERRDEKAGDDPRRRFERRDRW